MIANYPGSTTSIYWPHKLIRSSRHDNYLLNKVGGKFKLSDNRSHKVQYSASSVDDLYPLNFYSGPAHE